MRSIYFDQALKNFRLHSFKPELVRTIDRKAVFLKETGNQVAGKQLMDEARVLYTEVVSSHRLAGQREFNEEELVHWIGLSQFRPDNREIL